MSQLQHVQLHSLSNFSFLKSASHPGELVQQAIELNYKALAITDECSFSGIVRGYAEAIEHSAYQDNKFQLLIGSEFYTEEGFNLIALAPSKIAYSQICHLITKARGRADKGSYQVFIEDFNRYLKDCLLIYSHDFSKTLDVKQLDDLFNHFKKNIWLGYSHQFTGLAEEHRLVLSRLASRFKAPIAACPKVYFHQPQRKALYDTVNAIRLGCTVDDLGQAFSAHREEHLHNHRKLQFLYSEKELNECHRIAKRCQFLLSELKYQYPKELVPPHLNPSEYLRQLVELGIQSRWPEGINDDLRATIEKELKLIQKLKYEYYFLSVYEIVEYARSQEILCQGRGSAANSVVCYCLGITSVNPKEINLLFERFISEDRNEPPDIDVDFEHERREEVIQHIYKKYGRDRSAITATIITYRHKSAIREVGKALGFNISTIEYLSKSLAWWNKEAILKEKVEGLGQNIKNQSLMDQRLKLFLHLVDEILGFPRHLSQHVGGFLISECPIAELVPIENASMVDRTVIQWDKLDIETLGLLKIDVLALGMLSAIRKSFDLLEKHHQQRFNLASIPCEDPAVYQMLQKGDSVGVFQVESRAQMSMLPRLKPKNFYDLVIEVAIVRPGPIQGDMVHPFLRRRDGIEPETYPSEALKAVLKRTLGVPIFQEQAISIAMVAADFSAGEADALRRAIANWGRHSKLNDFKERLLKGMAKNNYSQEFSERIWEQIMGFAGYGFPESHAASFALLVYVSSWLKCHHPAVFCCALLNSLPMGFYTPSQLIQDIRRHHVEVLPIDILKSEWDHHLEEHTVDNKKVLKLRLGFRLVKGLKQERIENFVKIREQGEYKLDSIYKLAQRFGLNKAELARIANADAFKELSGHRYQSRWQVNTIEEAPPLFETVPQSSNSALPSHIQAPSDAQNVMEDYKHAKLSLRQHPMLLLRQHPDIKHCKNFEQIKQIRHGGFVQVAGLVTGRQRPGSAKGVIFLTLEDETGNNNIVCWRSVVERQREIIIKARALKIKGHIEREKDVVHVIAGVLEDLSHLVSDLDLHSRDFH